jgi:heat shock protein HslJ
MAHVNQAAGRLWTLAKLQGSEVRSVDPPTLQFAKGKLAVFGGVNRLTGDYALVDDRVVISELASTRMAGPPELIELETNFAKVLGSVDAFHVEGRVLELLQDGNVVATFHVQ